MPGLGSEPTLFPKTALQEGSALHSISRPLIARRTHLPPPEGHAERETAPLIVGLLSIDAKAGIATLNQEKELQVK